MSAQATPAGVEEPASWPTGVSAGAAVPWAVLAEAVALAFGRRRRST